MPLREEYCVNEGCEQYGSVVEEYFSHCDTPPRVCAACGGRRLRKVSLPAVIWTRPWGEYGDPTKERYNPEGVITYRKKSSRNQDGSPERVFLRTKQDVDSYCKAEGLVPPHELPVHAEISQDGTQLKSSGNVGQWV